MNRHNFLSSLSLARRGGMLEIGDEPVAAIARAHHARVIFVAKDAADNTKRRADHLADTGNCILLTVPYTKAELGQTTGRASAALLAITDIGFANTLVRQLAQNDPGAYDAARQRMELKAKRAAQRKREQLQHEKNVKSGKLHKRKPTASVVPNAPAAPAAQTSERRPSEPHHPQKIRKPTSYRGEGHSPAKGRNFAGPGSSRRNSASSGQRTRKRSNSQNRFPGSHPVKKGKGSPTRNG